MYRIKLTNGTVLEFDSLDALTVDIHAGVVDADALIFHQRANQWLPIHVHPAWKHAMAAPRKTPPAAKPTGATPPRGTSASASASSGTTGSAPAAALRPLPRAAQTGTEKPSTPAPKAPPSSTGPSSSATGGASASAATATSTGLASLDLDLIEPEESAPAPAPATKSMPKAKPAPKPAPTAAATAVETPTPTAASPAAKSSPRPTAAAAPKSSAGTEPPKTGPVSVDSLDEVLELIAPEELEVPAPPPAIAPRPAPKAPPREEAAPIVQVAAQASATNAALAALGRDAVPVASTPASTPTVTQAPASTATPTVAAEAQAPATAAQPAAPVALPVPAPTASAETLVPSSTLLVVPVEENVTLAAPAPERATSDTITTTDLASDFAIEVHPLPVPEPVESPVAAEEPVPAFTTTAEHALPSPVAAAPGPRAPNRTLWYVGGALAAGVAITAIALGGRGKDEAAAPTVATEQRSANPALPGAPLAPPAAPGGDSAPVLGRIEPPAESVPDADAAERGDTRTAETRKAREEAAAAKPARDAKADRGAKAELAEAKAVDEKKGKGDSAKPARTGDDGVIVAPSADFKSLGTIAVKADVNPNVLASRYASAHDAAWNDLVARLRLAGFDNLFAPARTAPSGASSARASVAAARAHIAQWRTRTSTIEKAYRDSSASLTAAGQWDAEELKAWEGRGRRGESGESAQQVNAILAAADRLFFILAANASGYETAADGLRFSDSGAQRDYWEARRAFLAAAGAAGSAEPRTPLAAVQKALGGRPPEGVNAN